MSNTTSLHLWTEADGSTRYTVFLGAVGGSAHCSQYSDRTPILSVWRTGVDVEVAPAGDTRVTTAELLFAQDLADMAAAYLAECKRFHVPEDESDEGTAQNVA